MVGSLVQAVLSAVRHHAVESGGGALPVEGTVTPEEALAAERARYAAQTANDFGAMERLFGDDLVYIHSNALVDTKASYIESMRSGAVRYRTMTPGETRVRCYGGLAIITGTTSLAVTVQGEDRTLDLAFHAIWARRAGGLQFVSWQSTRLPAKA